MPTFPSKVADCTDEELASLFRSTLKGYNTVQGELTRRGYSVRCFRTLGDTFEVDRTRIEKSEVKWTRL